MSDNIILGAGLISLDVLIRDGERLPVSYYVGGSLTWDGMLSPLPVSTARKIPHGFLRI